MAALSGTSVSSNWKKLQEKLKTEDKPKKQQRSSADLGVKRKRFASKTSARDVGTKRRKTMGNYFSSNMPQNGQTTPKSPSNLIKDHDIDPADVYAAYNGGPQDVANLRTSSSSDEINGGLHPSHKSGKYIALDCEMVGTGPPPDHADNLLARVSVVNFHGEQLYDSYVLPLPGIEVADYRTEYSGIRPHHLRPSNARTFTNVQRDIAALMQDRILVGHALRNDLAVLMLSHPARDIRDTSRHPKYRIASKGKAPALRNLARDELGWTIQTGEHSSLEDARATMALFRKEKKGFEEENRRRFGQARVVKGEKVDNNGRTVKEDTPADAIGSDQDDDAEEDDLDDLLEGEEDDLDAPGPKGSTAGKSKKRKKKKRTKRK